MDVPQQLEKHFRLHEHLPVKRFDFGGYTVFISSGGPYHSDIHDPKHWYESAFALWKKGTLFYQPLIFDADHDPQYTYHARENMRVNSAVKAAILTIEDANGLRKRF